MKKNFTFNDSWINALYIRYDLSKLHKYGELYFFEKENIMKCQHFFEFYIEKEILSQLKPQLEKNKKIIFNYLDNMLAIDNIEDWCRENGYKFEIIDKWSAPILFLECSFDEYIKKKSSKQIKKNYNFFQNNKKNYIIKNSDQDDIVELWRDVLIIDNNSWKKSEYSDMKNLDREDLQYFLKVINDRKNVNLSVLYDNVMEPVAYSLMFKNYDMWYQVKWGASTKGRKNFCGFIILFSHIEYLYGISKFLKLDFWGRKSRVYDQLKNKEKLRCHIMVSKE